MPDCFFYPDLIYAVLIGKADFIVQDLTPNFKNKAEKRKEIMPHILNDILYTAVDSFAAAIILFLLARLMGKKQISQLTFFDYIVGISIGSIAAAVSVDRRVSLFNGIVSMIVWTALPIIFSFISVHSMSFRRMLDGTPTILIQNGKIMEKNLRKLKFTVNDLLEELRIKDIFNIAEVEFAILETSGKLSVLKKSPDQPAVFANVIIDGKLMKENLKQISIDEEWLMVELKKNGLNTVADILLAVCDGKHHLIVYKKGDDPAELKIFQ